METITIETSKIDFKNYRALLDSLLAKIREYSQINLDLSMVEYVDSSGVSLFVSLYRETRAQQKDLHLINANARVYELFQITKLDSIIKVSKKA